ncbi:hypothetical protein ACIQV3_08690 [Streptomyces sp. NPDC099050]|uniref:hypothetical protein n=1 Tax=Streptomyces sp. NPDC099050 TaxID=3366100 RepID=UPI0037F5C16D
MALSADTQISVPVGPVPVPPLRSEGDGRQPTPVWVLGALGVFSAAALTGACWVSGHVHADPTLQTTARFLHLAAMVVGLGAVLAVDWFAILWLLGRRRLADILNTATTLQVPIWGGLAGLLVTGLFLSPNMESKLTLTKITLVLVITLNGLYAHWLGQRLERYQYRDTGVPVRFLVQSGAAATVSQTGWWGAGVIGFLNSQS